GRSLISGGGDNTAIIWDVESGQALYRLRGHTAAIYGVGFSPDGAQAVTASQDHTLRLWDARSGALITPMIGHADKVSAMAINSKDGTIASGADDGEIRLWNGRTGKFISTLGYQGANRGGYVGALAFSPDGRRLLSTCGFGGCQYTQRVWDLPTGKTVA